MQLFRSHRTHLLTSWVQREYHSQIQTLVETTSLSDHTSHLSKPSQVWEPQDTYQHAEEQGSSRNSLLAVDNNTSLESVKDESGMDMPRGPEMTQQSWSQAAFGSYPPKAKDSDSPGVPALAQPYCQSLARTLTLLLKYFWVHATFRCMRT